MFCGRLHKVLMWVWLSTTTDTTNTGSVPSELLKYFQNSNSKLYCLVYIDLLLYLSFLCSYLNCKWYGRSTWLATEHKNAPILFCVRNKWMGFDDLGKAYGFERCWKHRNPFSDLWMIMISCQLFVIFKVAIRSRVWHPVLAFRKLVNI